MAVSETFEQYLERTLRDSGLRSYGHNKAIDLTAEQMCYQRAVDCYYPTDKPAPEGDPGPPWGIHTTDPEDAPHGAALAPDALVYLSKGIGLNADERGAILSPDPNATPTQMREHDEAMALLDDVGKALDAGEMPHRCPGIGIVDTVSSDWDVLFEDTNPKDRAAQSKVPMWSLPAIGPVHGAMSTADGIRKGYGPYNWRDKPISMMEHIGALERHIAALKDGEDFTRDSNVTHLGCVIAGASIILDAQQCGTLIDDRPTPGTSTSADALEDYHDRNTEI